MKANRNSIGLLVLGGAAIKITNGLKDIDLDTTVTPALVPLYIDTSLTEVTYVLPNNKINVIETHDGFTGSGGNRGSNLQAIKSQLPSIIANYLNSNTDIKIINIIFSTGGGSGSTLAFFAIQELIKAEVSIMCYVSNTPNSLHRAINATAAITSLNNAAIKANVVIPISPYDTTIKESFMVSDKILLQDLICNASMLHSSNIGVDDGDRRTVLNPMVGVKDVTVPGVKFMHNHKGYGFISKYPTLSVLTYVQSGSDDDIGTNAINMFSGVLSDGLKDNYAKDTDAVSLIISEGMLNEWIGKLNDTVDKLKRSADTKYVGKAIHVTSSVTSDVDDDGFIC